MSEWREIELGVLCNVKGGKRLPKGEQLSESPTDHPYIRTRDLANNKIATPDLLFVPNDVFPKISRYIVEEGDIIISIVGTIGLVARIPKELHLASLTENCAKLVEIDLNLLDKEFLFYFLISDAGQDEIDQRNVGSTQPKLPLYNIQTIPIPVPPLPEQRAIAEVLSSLDDKIDLLHRQNKTLEQLAETLFRQWFIEEAKAEWEEVKLGEYVQTFNGVSYKSIELDTSETAMVTLKSFDRNGGFKQDGFKEYIGKYKPQHIVNEGDLLVAHTDITQNAEVIGNPVMVVGNPKYKTLIYSMDIVKVVPITQFLPSQFLYVLMRSRDFKEHCLGYTNGSTVLHMSKSAIPEYEFKLPELEKINKFTIIVSDLFKKQFSNIHQIKTLETLRDTLLPKLMSGEVRVEMVKKLAIS